MARFSRARLSESEAQMYGFRWGPMDVTRAAHLEGRGYVVHITTDHLQVEVYVSEQGRRYTVVTNGSGRVVRRGLDDVGG